MNREEHSPKPVSASGDRLELARRLREDSRTLTWRAERIDLELEQIVRRMLEAAAALESPPPKEPTT